MTLSRERLLTEAAATGFRPEILEKALHLLTLLERLGDHPWLKGRWALKGGTALNLFVFDLPRLSVDVDLNYIGAVDLAVMRAERPQVEEAIRAVCHRRQGRRAWSRQASRQGGAGGAWLAMGSPEKP